MMTRLTIMTSYLPAISRVTTIDDKEIIDQEIKKNLFL